MLKMISKCKIWLIALPRIIYFSESLDPSSSKKRKQNDGKVNSEKMTDSAKAHTRKDREIASSEQRANPVGVSALKEAKSGVVAIKNLKKSNQKRTGGDIFASFQTDIGSGTCSSWW